MPKKGNAVEAASHRIAILREIVRRERAQAEANPGRGRNIELGITEQDQTREDARARIAAVFDELDHLLDHLGIAHMADCFEAAALERMKTVIGESRSAIEKARKGRGRWPANLVRSSRSFEGLHDIGSVMALDAQTQAMFSAIRDIRNAFGHAPRLDRPSAVTGGETLETLSGMLAELR